MVVASLRYRLNAPAPEEDKRGFVVYDGNPSDYHHWVFKTDIQMLSIAEDDKDKASKVREVARTIVNNLL